jgi:hypothetical protein
MISVTYYGAPLQPMRPRSSEDVIGGPGDHLHVPEEPRIAHFGRQKAEAEGAGSRQYPYSGHVC